MSFFTSDVLFAKLRHRSVVDRAASGGNGEQACFAEVARVAEWPRCLLALRFVATCKHASRRSRGGAVAGPMQGRCSGRMAVGLAAAADAAHRQPSATAGLHLNGVRPGVQAPPKASARAAAQAPYRSVTVDGAGHSPACSRLSARHRADVRAFATSRTRTAQHRSALAT